MNIKIYYLSFISIMNLVTFALYKSDKHRALNRHRRIRETTLLGTGILGGAIGALFGMVLFHHKTKHGYFWTINFLSALAHAAIILQILAV